jgi:MYXO-CTERM domain-containing protein
MNTSPIRRLSSIYQKRHLLSQAFMLSVLSFVCLSPSAFAFDALNGKKLYLNGPTSGGASCAQCHSSDPANNINNIQVAAGNPTAIANAIAQNRGGMGIFRNKFTSAELSDLAGFIANPAVSAGPIIGISPANLSFSPVTVGQTSSALSTTITNTGTGPLQLSSINLTSSDFALAGGTCTSGASIAPSASCTVAITFRPSAAGARSATLALNHNATGGSSQVGLSGTGNVAPQASIAMSASSLSFSNLIVNTLSDPQTATITNSGQAPLSFTALTISGANASLFQLSGTCSTQTAVPVGGQCTLSVKAQLAQAGTAIAAIQVQSNAANGVAVLNLSATAALAAPAITSSSNTMAFGAQTLGAASTTQSVTLTNTGNVPVNITSVKTTGSNNVSIAAGTTCSGNLALNAKCVVQVSLNPATLGDVNANVNVAWSAGSTNATSTIAVLASIVNAAVAKPVLSDSATLDFANTQIGATSAKRTTTLSNQGGLAFKINSLALSGSHASDFVLGGTCVTNAVVAAAANCSIETSFKPSAAGLRSANVLIVTDGGAQLNLGLQGTGVVVPNITPMLSLTPASHDFGSIRLGDADPSRKILLKNESNTAISLITPEVSGPFLIAKDGNTCPAFPFQLAAMASCELNVQFHPSVVGAAVGSVKLLTSDPKVNWTLSLTGTGEAAAVVTPTTTASNTGGGGCSVSKDGRDPMLAILVILASLVLWRRRRQWKHNES